MGHLDKGLVYALESAFGALPGDPGHSARKAALQTFERMQPNEHEQRELTGWLNTLAAYARAEPGVPLPEVPRAIQKAHAKEITSLEMVPKAIRDLRAGAAYPSAAERSLAKEHRRIGWRTAMRYGTTPERWAARGWS